MPASSGTYTQTDCPTHRRRAQDSPKYILLTCCNHFRDILTSTTPASKYPRKLSPARGYRSDLSLLPPPATCFRESQLAVLIINHKREVQRTSFQPTSISTLTFSLAMVSFSSARVFFRVKAFRLISRANSRPDSCHQHTERELLFKGHVHNLQNIYIDLHLLKYAATTTVIVYSSGFPAAPRSTSLDVQAVQRRYIKPCRKERQDTLSWRTHGQTGNIDSTQRSCMVDNAGSHGVCGDQVA